MLNWLIWMFNFFSRRLNGPSITYAYAIALKQPVSTAKYFGYVPAEWPNPKLRFREMTSHTPVLICDTLANATGTLYGHCLQDKCKIVQVWHLKEKDK